MRKYIPELDGLRALSVLVVITSHMHARIWKHACGGLGVVVFFVLSGYLITTLALREEEESGAVSLKAFYLRRSFRIFPLYFLILGVYAMLIYVLHFGAARAQDMTKSLPYLLTYMQEFAHARHDFVMPYYQTWSLGIEEKFYLVWPLLAFVLLKRHRVHLALALASLFAVTAYFAGTLDSSLPYSVVPYGHILIGCCLALLQSQLNFARIRAMWPLVLATLLILHTVVIPRYYDQKLWMTLYALFVAVLVGIVVQTESPLNRMLSWRPLVFVGKVSYGVYLIHILCLNVVEKFVKQPVLAYLGTCALAVGIAAVLHFTFEQPLINIGRRLSARAMQASDERKPVMAAVAN